MATRDACFTDVIADEIADLMVQSELRLHREINGGTVVEESVVELWPLTNYISRAHTESELVKKLCTSINRMAKPAQANVTCSWPSVRYDSSEGGLLTAAVHVSFDVPLKFKMHEAFA